MKDAGHDQALSAICAQLQEDRKNLKNPARCHNRGYARQIKCRYLPGSRCQHCMTCSMRVRGDDTPLAFAPSPPMHARLFACTPFTYNNIRRDWYVQPGRKENGKQSSKNNNFQSDVDVGKLLKEPPIQSSDAQKATERTSTCIRLKSSTR